MKITRNKILLFIIAATAVMLFGGCSSEEKENNIESLLCPFLDDGELELLLGESSSGWVNPYIRNEDLFSAEDVVFVSDNPDVASIKFTEEKNGNFIYYQIDGVGIGDTYVYAQSYNGEVLSDKQHVIVTETITETVPDIVDKTVVETEKEAKSEVPIETTPETSTMSIPETDAETKSENAVFPETIVEAEPEKALTTYVLNTNTKKFTIRGVIQQRK